MKTRTSSKKANSTESRLQSWMAATGGRVVFQMTQDFTGWTYTLTAGGRQVQATAATIDAAAEAALAAWN